MPARSATWVATTAAVISGWITLVAPAAFAQPVPPDGPPHQTRPVAPVRVVEVGSPIWQFLLVAVVAGGLAIVVQRVVAHRPSQ